MQIIAREKDHLSPSEDERLSPLDARVELSFDDVVIEDEV
jgi:hypothetical protein